MDNIPILISDFLNRIQVRHYTLTSINYDPTLEPLVQRAVNLKRTGNYGESVLQYIQIMDDNCVAQSALLFYMYKSLASAGFISEAYAIIELSNRIMKIKNLYSFTGQDEHIEKLNSALQSESYMSQYLGSISGNPIYSLNRSIKQVMNEPLNKYISIIDSIIN